MLTLETVFIDGPALGESRALKACRRMLAMQMQPESLVYNNATCTQSTANPVRQIQRSFKQIISKTNTLEHQRASVSPRFVVR